MQSLKTILYFSLFRYPLFQEEIHSYANHNDWSKTKSELDLLIQEKIVKNIDGFYVFDYDFESVSKRLKGNDAAKKATIIAKKRAKFIAKFPFVRAVGVSGSLSKGYFDNESDIDFFVITTPNKLWLCRTLLMLYKKIFLLNSRKYFCINYFVSENNLEIEEKNRFTATELKTLIPLEGKMLFDEFFKQNLWVLNYFPNFVSNTEQVHEIRKTPLKIFLELLFTNKIGQTIDNFLKNITFKKWRSKFQNLEKNDFDVALKSTKNISKHHPHNFQKKVIDALNEKALEVKNKFNIELTTEHV
jgi:predicted nucleotidyltransferase